MKIKIIHTSDWQIGKVFRFVDDQTMGLLQEARLEAINRLGEFAEKNDVHHILVAGDIYDMEALSPRSLNQPIERMRNFPGVTWHLLPGNHDPHRSNGLWDRLSHGTLPNNIHVHTRPEPVILKNEPLVLLPAPLLHRKTLEDPTAYMDNLSLPEGLMRVGIAHGTVVGFGSDDKSIPNHIAPDRPVRARLSYLALGDWHGQRKINNRCWYSGTPETDGFDVLDGGRALLVEIDDAGTDPKITPFDTGRYRWIRLIERINGREDIDFLSEKIRNVDENLNRMLVHLKVEGTLSLGDREYFQQQITDGVSAALCFLRIDDSQLLPSTTEEDLDRIDKRGFVRAAAEKLKRMAEEGNDSERRLAAEALQRLYLEHTKLEAERR